MSLTEEATVAADQVFINRVAAAAVRKAVLISAESSSGLNPPRKALARQVLKDPNGQATLLAKIVVRDPTISARSPLTVGAVLDTEITAALTDVIWDGYAQTFTT